MLLFTPSEAGEKGENDTEQNGEHDRGSQRDNAGKILPLEHQVTRQFTQGNIKPGCQVEDGADD